VIEGPPGTGKTQTILNIVANILLRDETVAILSNNNSAVDNVVEKLQKSDLDYLVAKLGSKAKRSAFFESRLRCRRNPPLPAPALEEIDAAVIRLKQYLYAHNRAAQLRPRSRSYRSSSAICSSGMMKTACQRGRHWNDTD
jgi:ABC-type transport system involved in cytochrome c biogenesis ATPase subunit